MTAPSLDLDIVRLDPALKAIAPNRKMKAPNVTCYYIIDRIYDQILLFLTNRFVATGIECGWIGLQFPFFSNRPVRGPVIKAAAKPADPPMA